MQYRITHTTEYKYSEASPVCHNALRLTPRRDGRQRCRQHQLRIEPEPLELGQRQDYFGNQVHLFSIHESHLGLKVTAKSEVEIESAVPIDPSETPAWEEIHKSVRVDRRPDDLAAYQFTFPSPRIKIPAGLAGYAEASFPSGRPILAAAKDLMARIHRDYRYDPKATTVDTAVEEVLKLKRGVCQDFAHLQIGCLRALGLPARYVSGYLRTLPPAGKPRLIGADASHAWLSVYCGETGWVDLDPTNDTIPNTDHITLAWGRDYGDVPPIRGVFVGGMQHALSVSVDVEPITSPPA